jgi:hypothetical protein
MKETLSMRKSYSVLLMALLFSLIPFFSRAQLGAVGVFWSYGINNITAHETYENFRNSYNSVIANNEWLETPLEEFPVGRGRSIGLQGNISGPMYVDLHYGRYENTAYANFQYGESRRVQMVRQDLDWMVAFGPGYIEDGRYGFLGVGFGLSAVFSSFRFSYKYAHGHYSFGEERPLNGVYANTALKPRFGLRAVIPVAPVLSVFAKADWQRNLPAAGGDFYYSDNGKGLGLEPYNKEHTLPQDYSEMLDGVSGTSGVDVTDRFTSFTAQIGIVFSLALE